MKPNPRKTILGALIGALCIAGAVTLAHGPTEAEIDAAALRTTTPQILRADAPVTVQPALLASYQYVTDLQPGVNGMAFLPGAAGVRPVQLDLTRPEAERATLSAVPPTYTGWDVLVANGYVVPRSKRADATQFTLNRPAKVALIWRTPARPAWLSDWTAGASVQVTRGARTQTWPTFQKTFQAGTVSLPGLNDVSDTDRTYDLLLSDLTPPQPAVQANAPCPAWVRSLPQYTATGPDGKTYPSWAPAIEPTYWCYLGITHGSRPPDGFRPLYGYTAETMGMKEPLGGFKTYVTAEQGGWLVITQHFGTGGPGRICTAMHTMDIAYVRAGQTLIDLHLMGDFGRATVVRDADETLIARCNNDLTSNGVRHINYRENGGYESWRASLTKVGAAGITGDSITFKTNDPSTSCIDFECSALIKIRDQVGADYTLNLDQPIRIAAPRGTSGEFYTDAMGRVPLSKGDAGAVRQYIAPGFALSLAPRGTCWSPDFWGAALVCDRPLLQPTRNLEGSLLPSN